MSSDGTGGREDGRTGSRRGLLFVVSAPSGTGKTTVVERLVQVRGVGRWTVEMLLMFRLGRPDVLPVSDLGIRKGFALTFGVRRLPAPVTISRRAQRWRPYRSVACWYLWRALEL